MSYPSPYTPPPGMYTDFNYYQPRASEPARRAGLLMYILGVLGILTSLCGVGVAVMLPRMMAEQPEMFSELRQMPQMTPEYLRAVMVGLSVMIFLAALTSIVLAGFVRSGRRGAIIVALVLSIIAELLLFLNLIGTALRIGGAAPSQAVGGLCMVIIPLVLFGLLITWLISALKSPNPHDMQQYAMQYWQYAQQQQAQGQPPPYGYPPMPPTPPPPQSPPPSA